MFWNMEDMQCLKSILFLYCDAWKDIRTESLIDIFHYNGELYAI